MASFDPLNEQALAICKLEMLVSRHRSSVCLRWPSKRIAALHRLPIRSVLAARCALRCAPMAARSLRTLIGDATLTPEAPCQCAPLSRGEVRQFSCPLRGIFQPPPRIFTSVLNAFATWLRLVPTFASLRPTSEGSKSGHHANCTQPSPSWYWQRPTHRISLRMGFKACPYTQLPPAS